MFCPACGVRFGTASAYCWNCGFRVDYARVLRRQLRGVYTGISNMTQAAASASLVTFSGVLPAVRQLAADAKHGFRRTTADIAHTTDVYTNRASKRVLRAYRDVLRRQLEFVDSSLRRMR